MSTHFMPQTFIVDRINALAAPKGELRKRALVVLPPPDEMLLLSEGGRTFCDGEFDDEFGNVMAFNRLSLIDE